LYKTKVPQYPLSLAAKGAIHLSLKSKRGMDHILFKNRYQRKNSICISVNRKAGG
jgi:hypothetical protein